MSTAQQSLVTVSVAGRPLGKFGTRTGGEVAAEPQKDYPGGMAPPRVYPVVPETGDVTVSRTNDDPDLTRWLRTQVGSAQMVVSDQPLDANKAPFGRPTVFTGVLTGLNGGDSDSASRDLKRLELTMTVSEES